MAVALLALAAAAGFLLYRLTAPSRSGLRVEDGRTAPRPPHRDGLVQAQVPQPPVRTIPEDLPTIALPGLDGTPRSLADFRGKLLLVNFWATWCEPCRREIPLLQGLRRERAKDGLEIVGIALDHRRDVEKYVQEHGMRYPVLVGEKGGLEAVNALGMDTVLPFSVFADRRGQIITLKIGELHADEAALILDRMTDLDHGRLTLTAAREQIASGIAHLSAARASVSAAPQ